MLFYSISSLFGRNVNAKKNKEYKKNMIPSMVLFVSYHSHSLPIDKKITILIIINCNIQINTNSE